jgi:hypothetical protein
LARALHVVSRINIVVNKPLFFASSTGTGAMCAINRSSVFILLLIQVNLCDLTRTLFQSIVMDQADEIKKTAKCFHVLAAGLPLLLMIIAYIVEDTSEDSPNYQVL